MDLWGAFSTWEVVNYDGAFFRAEGGNADDFIEKTGDLVAQAEGLPNIVGSLFNQRSFVSDGYNYNGALTVSESYNGSDGFFSLGWSEYAGRKNCKLNFNAAKSNSIYGQSYHVTPINYTYRIWKRIS